MKRKLIANQFGMDSAFNDRHSKLKWSFDSLLSLFSLSQETIIFQLGWMRMKYPQCEFTFSVAHIFWRTRKLETTNYFITCLGLKVCVDANWMVEKNTKNDLRRVRVASTKSEVFDKIGNFAEELTAHQLRLLSVFAHGETARSVKIGKDYFWSVSIQLTD